MPPKPQPLTDAQARADSLLAELARLSAERQAAEAAAQAEIEAVRIRHARNIEALTGQINRADRDLLDLLKSETQAVYQGADKRILPHGLVLHAQADQVRIPRTALESIKEAGWTEAIRVTEAVKREVVETWPLERLTVIGATRRTVDKYSYEVRG